MKNEMTRSDLRIPPQFLEVAGLSAGGTMMTIAPGVMILMNPNQDEDERRQAIAGLRRAAAALGKKGEDSEKAEDLEDGFYIPSDLLWEADLDPNDRLDVIIEKGAITIRPAQDQVEDIFTEEELLRGVSLLRTLGMPLGLLRKIFMAGDEDDAR